MICKIWLLIYKNKIGQNLTNDALGFNFVFLFLVFFFFTSLNFFATTLLHLIGLKQEHIGAQFLWEKTTLSKVKFLKRTKQRHPPP